MPRVPPALGKQGSLGNPIPFGLEISSQRNSLRKKVQGSSTVRGTKKNLEILANSFRQTIATAQP